MPSHLIIIFELAIILTAYWYFYKRQPKTLKIDKSIWGRYDSGNQAINNSAIDKVDTVAEAAFNSLPACSPFCYHNHHQSIEKTDTAANPQEVKKLMSKLADSANKEKVSI
jgi:hypothetical protein